MPRKKPGRQKQVAAEIIRRVTGVRPQVVAFAHAMERVLKRHDNKGSWKELTNDRLYFLLLSEIAELAASIGHKHGVAGEAVDVANYAMMLFDNNKKQRNG